MSNLKPHFTACDYLSMLGLKLIHIDERGPSYLFSETWVANNIFMKYLVMFDHDL